jgi:hypothetical protein
MIQVMEGLVFGNETICTHDSSGSVAVVHACKDPCHRSAVGYTTRSIPNSHPNYLGKETEYHLYLNLIDPPQPLFRVQSFVVFLAFMEKHIGERQIVIHCNQGESRAPSLALLYLAKRTAIIPSSSYPIAAAAFRTNLYPGYQPGRGIEIWLTQHWGELQ